MTWAQLPLLRLSITFITGIVAAYFYRGMLSDILVISILASATLGVLALFFKVSSGKAMLLASGIIPLIASFICGFGLMRASKTDEQKIRKLIPGYYVSKAASEPLIKGKWKRCKIKILSKAGDQEAHEFSGSVMLYMPVETNIKMGDILLVHLRTLPSRKIPNPGEFNYAEYLEKQNVSATLFIKDTIDVMVIKPGEGIIKAINEWRSELIMKIRGATLSPDTKALLMSLVLGAADDLDPSLRSSFSASGTMHVLSVSGMHIALLYLLFVRFFSMLRLHKRLSFLLIIVLIWLYAGLTGFSPSVLRAAVICSFMVLGEAASRISNSMNLLAGSAILLLSFDPFLLFNPGFQLSYSAVAGIILFQKKLNNLFPAEGKIAKEVTNAITVTLAAQIGTIGVSLYYFGQFPVYFLFANLVIVPISSILLYAGIVYILLLLITTPFTLVDSAMDLLFEIFTATVNYFGTLPGAIMHIKFDLFFMVIIYLVLLSIYCYGANKWKTALIVSALVFSCSMYRLTKAFSAVDRKLIIYDSKEPVVGVSDRTGIFRWKVDSLTNGASNRHLYRNGLFASSGQLILIAGHSVSKINPDILLLTRNCKIKNEELLRRSALRQVVIAHGVSKKRTEDMKKRCAKSGLECWNIPEQGAFVLDVR